MCFELTENLMCTLLSCEIVLRKRTRTWSGALVHRMCRFSRGKILAVLLVVSLSWYIFLDGKDGNQLLPEGMAVFKSAATRLTHSGNQTSISNGTGRYVSIQDSNNSMDLFQFSSVINFNVPEDRRPCKDRRFLVYTCRSTCGGWGDRLKGITTTFLLAQITNRTFLIDMPKPCPLQDILIRNTHDWITCLDVATNVSKDHEFHTKIMSGSNQNKMLEIIAKDKEHFTVISIQSNIRGIQFLRKHANANVTMPWLDQLNDAEVIGSILGILFKPSMDLHSSLVSFFKDHVGTRKLVCSHIRQGRNPSIPNDTVVKTPNVSTVLKFLKQFDTHDAKHSIFVATDSEGIRNKSRQFLTNYVSTERAIVHVDKTRLGTDESCAGFMTAVLEQLLLAHCHVLVLTHSNFGAMAAYMRGHSDNLYLYNKPNNSILSVNVEDVQKIYKFV